MTSAERETERYLCHRAAAPITTIETDILLPKTLRPATWPGGLAQVGLTGSSERHEGIHLLRGGPAVTASGTTTLVDGSSRRPQTSGAWSPIPLRTVRRWLVRSGSAG